jgi:general secretion pathway protein G
VRRWFRRSSAGYTFIELVVATAVMMILASAALPLARVSIRRQRESDTRRALREMRTAIDNFKRLADSPNGIASTEMRVGCENYPPSLEILVDGATRANDASGRKVKFLRRIPIDPLIGRAEWGLRSYADPPNATTWGGQCVFDVYSKAEGTGLDGTKYREW